MLPDSFLIGNFEIWKKKNNTEKTKQTLKNKTETNKSNKTKGGDFTTIGGVCRPFITRYYLSPIAPTPRPVRNSSATLTDGLLTSTDGEGLSYCVVCCLLVFFLLLFIYLFIIIIFVF